MGVEFSAFHAAACLSCLPLGASLLSAIDKRASWTHVDYMLHAIVQALAGKELPYPWEKKNSLDGIETEGLPLDEFEEWYGSNNWEEVDNWRVL